MFRLLPDDPDDLDDFDLLTVTEIAAALKVPIA
jgi:hypothetical protein